MSDDLLGAILAELRQMNATLRRQTRSADARAALVDAVRDALGPAKFTSGGLLDLAREEPALADALSAMVDVEARGAAISLSRAISCMPEFEQAGARRGAMLFRLRD